jgi:hypothetical protein
MIPQNFIKRLVYPTATVFVIMTVSWAGYFGSRHIDGAALHQLLAKIFGTAYFISIAFGTLYVYTVSYIRGASLRERILASAVNPFIWMTKESLSLLVCYTPLQCLYWYLNPLNFWLVCLMALEMGIATLAARWILNRRGEPVGTFTPGALATIVVSLAFIIAAYAWGKGENLYAIFLAGSRFFFGPGI